jgi:hypothetical protein
MVNRSTQPCQKQKAARATFHPTLANKPQEI